MKKLLAIVVLGLLLAGCATTDDVQIYHKDENSIKMSSSGPSIKKQIEIAVAHCAKYKKFAAIYDPAGSFALCTKKEPVKKRLVGGECKSFGKCKNLYWTNFYKSSELHSEINKESKKVELASMINEAKKTCKELGFKEGTEKFSDCSLKLYSQAVELAAKNNQTVVMQPQSSGSNTMTIYDPRRDSRILKRQGQRMLSGACTLGINC